MILSYTDDDWLNWLKGRTIYLYEHRIFGAAVIRSRGKVASVHI